MKKNYTTLAMLVLSITLIMIGLMKGQNASVLQKAVIICLECIGIG